MWSGLLFLSLFIIVLYNTSYFSLCVATGLLLYCKVTECVGRVGYDCSHKKLLVTHRPISQGWAPRVLLSLCGVNIITVLSNIELCAKRYAHAHE